MGKAFFKNYLIKILFLFSLPLIWGCEFPNGAKIVAYYEGSVVVSYNVRGTYDVNAFVIDSGTTLVLRDQNPQHWTFAYLGQSDQGFQLFPGINPATLSYYLRAHNRALTTEQANQQAGMTAYKWAQDSDFLLREQPMLLEGSGAVLVNSKINSNQPITFNGILTQVVVSKPGLIQWISKTAKDLTDIILTPINALNPNQVYTSGKSEPITLEVKIESPPPTPTPTSPPS